MAKGTLKIFATTGDGAIPVAGASYAIKDKSGNVLFSGITNENGESGVYTLEAPPRELSLTPNPGVRAYGVYDVWIAKPGFVTVTIIDVEVMDGLDAIQSVDLQPVTEGNEEEATIIIPPPTVAMATPTQEQEGTDEVKFGGDLAEWQIMEGVSSPVGAPVTVAAQAAAPRTLSSVIIPDYITVHLGRPANSAAPRTRVRFIDYVKNVTCSEIYATWPTNSIIANVHCIVSFALNRVYTEWYRTRGYTFDITNSTTVDQYFVPGRTIFQNISQIVDGIFNVYARRSGFRNPYFTEYCSGTTATCKGLSQWGTVTLANRGFTPIQILHNFYPRDLILVTAPSGTVRESYPGVVLERGSTGENVRLIQNRLNRIRANFPAIPQIPNPNGVFGVETENAVRIFQRTFNLLQDGRVGRSTWNAIMRYWVSITKLSELNGEGERIGLDPNPPTVVIRQGSRGADVIHAQFILNFVAQFYPDINPPIMDSIFGASTDSAVRAFQRRFGLTVDGVVGPNTWRRMYEVYRTLQGQTPPPPNGGGGITPPTRPPFPGVLLRRGSTGPSVRTLQELINNSRRTYAAVPALNVDGVFGPLTENSVRTFQRFAGLTVDGIVGPITWNALTALL